MKKWSRLPFSCKVKDVAISVSKLVAEEWDITVPQLLNFNARPEFTTEPRRALVYILSMHGTGPSKNVADYFKIKDATVRRMLLSARDMMKDNKKFNMRCKEIYKLTSADSFV